MKLSLPYRDFTAFTVKQLNNLFPDGHPVRRGDIRRSFDTATERTANCFRHVSLRGYAIDGVPCLNHLHSDQYAVYLWFLSNAVWTDTQHEAIANKLFCLNKALHGFSCLYDTALPDRFILLHATGTVLGKAQYGDRFVAAQGCTVGAHHGCYPVLGCDVALLPGAAIVGECRIGDRVSVGIGATVYGQDVPDDSVVFRDAAGKLNVKHAASPWAANVFASAAI